MRNSHRPTTTVFLVLGGAVWASAFGGCSRHHHMREALTAAPDRGPTSSLLGQNYHRPAFTPPMTGDYRVEPLATAMGRAPASVAPGTRVALTTTATAVLRPGQRETAELNKIVQKLDAHPILREADPVCQSIEYAGSGKDLSAAEPGRWSTLNSLFVDARDHLLSWLEQNRAHFNEKTFASMREQVASVRLEKESLAAEADLGWRGIGVWMRDAQGAVSLKVGSGFTTLAQKDSARAKFELVRLLAQLWAPCELERQKIQMPWTAFLNCMDFPPSALGCGPGGYSEAGWAVSSAVAIQVSPPGCRIPAFTEPGHAACPKDALMPLLRNSTRSTAEKTKAPGVKTARQ